MTTYEATYGQKPLPVTSYLLGASMVQSMDNSLNTNESIIHTLKDNLIMDQNIMKQQVDQHLSKHSFVEVDWVFLHLQPHKQISLKDKIP
jgi:hypothetical protein